MIGRPRIARSPMPGQCWLRGVETRGKKVEDASCMLFIVSHCSVRCDQNVARGRGDLAGGVNVWGLWSPGPCYPRTIRSPQFTALDKMVLNDPS